MLHPALQSALIAVAARLDGVGVSWVAAGSTARALAGFAVVPRDLDIETSATQLARAAAALGLAPSRYGDPQASSLRARGMLGDVEVDLSGGLAVHGPGGNLPADFPLMRLFARDVRVGDRQVAGGPVEEQIARAVVMGDEARLERIAREAPVGYALGGTYLSLRLAAASARR